jgi:tRNA/rRNA methyltransferase
MNDPLARIRIVLSRTSHPGNIGAAARAMKTMGLRRLVLVEPRRFPDDEATARASGATEVLEAATVSSSLAEALRGTVLAAGFTSRRRELGPPVRWLREAAAEIVAEASAGEVALIFGNETFGLSNEELALCQIPVLIPANPDYASLNLAAAVQVACYELRMACGGPPPAGPAAGFEAATLDEIEGLFSHLSQAMLSSGFLDPAHPGRLMPRLRRLFARTRLERDEVNILRGMLNSFARKVD